MGGLTGRRCSNDAPPISRQAFRLGPGCHQCGRARRRGAQAGV